MAKNKVRQDRQDEMKNEIKDQKSGQGEIKTGHVEIKKEQETIKNRNRETDQTSQSNIEQRIDRVLDEI